MKKYILFLAIIFTCVFMFNIAPAFAKKPGTDRVGVPSDNPGCEGTAAGTCVTINGYTIKAFYYEDGDPLQVTDFALEGGKWPTINGDGNTEYTYWAGRTVATESPPTPSYLILDLEGIPVDTDPPGAQLPLSPFDCDGWKVESSRIPFKINPNPTLSSDRDIVFKLTEPAGYTYDTCSGNAFMKFNDGCYPPDDSGTLMMPDSDGPSPWVQKRRFECSTTNAMLVEYEHCTEIPIKVGWEVGGAVVENKDNIDYFKEPWIFLYGPGIEEDDDGNRYRLDDLENVGPAKGTVLCTEDEVPGPAPPVFLWKDRGYFSAYPGTNNGQQQP